MLFRLRAWMQARIYGSNLSEAKKERLWAANRILCGDPFTGALNLALTFTRDE